VSCLTTASNGQARPIRKFLNQLNSTQVYWQKVAGWLKEIQYITVHSDYSRRWISPPLSNRIGTANSNSNQISKLHRSLRIPIHWIRLDPDPTRIHQIHQISCRIQIWCTPNLSRWKIKQTKHETVGPYSCKPVSCWGLQNWRSAPSASGRTLLYSMYGTTYKVQTANRQINLWSPVIFQ